VNDHQADALSKRIASLESRFAGSWACQTREEYEKALKQELKQEIMGYLVKISVGLIIFLGGAGALLINLMIESTYQRENAAMIKDLQARYDAHVKEDLARLEWQRFHNYGVTYRYLGELYSVSSVPEEIKKKKLQDIFDRAKTYYDLALKIDPKQPTTHFELGQIYHTYPIRFGVQSWKKDQDAIDEYRHAIEFMADEDVSKGWRAEALTMLAETELDTYVSSSEANRNKQLLDRAEKELQQADAEYARAIPEVSTYNQDYSATNNKLLKKVGCLRDPGAASSATCTEMK
jgi:hypothetical protein